MCRYSKTAAQVMIRWSLQCGFVCIPKSSNEKRIAENANVFDFDITGEDMQTLVSKVILVVFTHGVCLVQNGLDEHFITDWPGIMMTPWKS